MTAGVEQEASSETKREARGEGEREQERKRETSRSERRKDRNKRHISEMSGLSFTGSLRVKHMQRTMNTLAPFDLTGACGGGDSDGDSGGGFICTVNKKQ